LPLLLAAAPARAFCVVNDSDGLLDVKAGGAIPVFYRGSVKPGERVCHIPKRTDIGITVEIFQGGKVSGRDLKCRYSVPAKDATITVGESCRLTVN
jgi:hypothetical protein